MSSPTVILMCGPAGAGKTTHAKALEADGYVRLSIDEEVWNSAGRYGVDYPAEDYEALSAAAEQRLQGRLLALLAEGRDVVIDFSFWQRARREFYKALVEDAGGRWRLLYLKVPPAELRRRLRLRAERFDADAAYPVSEGRLGRYLESFEEPRAEGEEIVTPG